MVSLHWSEHKSRFGFLPECNITPRFRSASRLYSRDRELVTAM